MAENMPSMPHRAHEVVLHISADSLDDLQRELEVVATKIERGEFSTWGISGGYGAGHRYEHRHDPEMTHERWAADNKAYCDALTAARRAAAEQAERTPDDD